jgi:hypothetical protein
MAPAAPAPRLRGRNLPHATPPVVSCFGLRYVFQRPSVFFFAIEKGGEEWTPSAVVLHGIPLSQTPK